MKSEAQNSGVVLETKEPAPQELDPRFPKFCAGEPAYKFEAVGEIKRIEIKGFRDRHLEVLPVSMAAMSEMIERLPNIKAIPAYYGYDDLNHVLWFHPLPKAEFEFSVKDERKPTKKEAA